MAPPPGTLVALAAALLLRQAAVVVTLAPIAPPPPPPPRLELIRTAPAPMALPSATTAFEGGTLLRTTTGLHLFTTDVSHGIVNTSLVYYHAANTATNFSFVREVSCCSRGAAGGPRGSLWAPMPAWDG
eukprot:SAG31_NODE_27441_length_426_cov_0.636086_1_plen_128_part_01